MTAYKSDYDTRLLYTQSYMADEGLHITTDMHAVLWTYPQATSPTTSRIRLTFIYTKEGAGISPVQGLIEQWKSEGWSVVDEYCDGYLEFDSVEEYRGHLLEMVRSFLLGVPFGAEVEGDVSPGPRKPPPSKGSKIPKLTGFTSRIDRLVKKSDEDPKVGIKEDSDDIYGSSNDSDSDVIKFPATEHVKSLKDDIPPPKQSNDVEEESSSDDDGDDWI